MFSPEGCYLVGDPTNGVFNRSLSEAVIEDRTLGDDVQILWWVVSPERWQERLRDMVRPRLLAEIRRFHYACSGSRYDWRECLPSGYAVRCIDAALLTDAELSVPRHVTRWIENNWGSVDAFLRLGFGCTTICEDEIVSWSLADCVSGEQCEIGIHTAVGHRRRGLGAATAAATVEHALSEGYASVGWHCPQDNLGSIGTAERVGFQRERPYSTYYVELVSRCGSHPCVGEPEAA
jgi:RimJ/RimL family protein N-acetyltransferase